MLMTSPVEEGDEKEDFEDEEALENDDIERSEADRPRTYSDIATDSRSFENGNSQSYRSGDDIGFWQMSASSDTDDELEVIVRPIPKTQAIEHLTREESLSSTREECLSSTREESLSSTREESISSPEHLTQTVISMSQPTPPESSLSITEVASHKIPRPPRKSMKPTHSQPKIQLPLLQDKELLRMMLTQMWKDVERKKENTAEDTSEISDEVLSSSSRLTRLLSSLSDTSRQSTVASPSRLSHPSGHLLRHSSFHQQSDTTAFDSTKRIAYFLKNILSTYYYIGYIILIVLVTASFQIYCTNKNNCPDFWGVFVAVQILLSADIFFRIIIQYPTYTTFFLSKNNLFDMFMVLIIWIPVYYTGYGSQIAGNSYLLSHLTSLPH